MRFRTKAAIMTAVAGPAIAAMILTGAGPANAAVTTAATPHTTTSTSFPGFPFCFRHHLELFNFNGDNTIDVTWNGLHFTYAVHFRQRGSCLGGFLTDPNIPNGPKTGPIVGTVIRHHVTFSFTYTYIGEVQGTRTYTGFIDHDGDVAGTFSQTGPQVPSTGTWSLEDQVEPACPDFFPFFDFEEFGAGCPVPFPFFFF